MSTPDDRRTAELTTGIAGMPPEQFKRIASRYLWVKSGEIRETDYCVSWPETHNGPPDIIQVPDKYLGKPTRSLHFVLVLRPL